MNAITHELNMKFTKTKIFCIFHICMKKNKNIKYRSMENGKFKDTIYSGYINIL